MYKLNVHSIVDVITNSSTVIYTYQDGVKEAKKLLQEILNLTNIHKDVDDLFNIRTFLSEYDYYTDYLDERVDDEELEYPEDYPKDDWKKQGEYVNNLIENILKGEAEKPEWMNGAEEQENWSGYTWPTSLYILPKDEKYAVLAKKMLAFLNSSDHEAFRDG